MWSHFNLTEAAVRVNLRLTFQKDNYWSSGLEREWSVMVLVLIKFVLIAHIDSFPPHIELPYNPTHLTPALPA